MKKSIFACTLASLILSACGGGGGGNSVSALAGVAVDGYIEGAVVCLDVNNSLTCDAGEPSAVTDSDGRYSLNTTGFDTSLYNVVVYADPETAKDKDDGGLTLAAAGKTALTLATPAIKPEVVSPFTTLLLAFMDQGLTLSEAQSKVAAVLKSSDSGAVFMDPAAPNSGLQVVARVLALEIMSAANATPTATPTEAPASEPTLTLVEAPNNLSTVSSGVANLNTTLNLSAVLDPTAVAEVMSAGNSSSSSSSSSNQLYGNLLRRLSSAATTP